MQRGRKAVRPLAVLVIALLIAGLAAFTDRAFVTPVVSKPEKADAVFILGGDGARFAVADRLFRQGYVSTVVVSEPQPNQICPISVPHYVTFICFRPHPRSTQGEGRELAMLAEQHGWHRVIVVSGHAQTLRARVRMQRCWDGQVLMIPAPAAPRLSTRLHDIAYEWAALLKAEVWQRSC